MTTPRRPKTSAASPDQVVELYGPERDGWFDTRVMDWVPLCEQLKDGEVRGYVILRSLIVDKFHKPVRVLTLQKLCELIPSPSGGPSSLTRVRGILDGLTRVGLVTTPEGEPLKTSSRPSATVKPLRIRVNDAAPADYTGWRNAEDKLKALGVALAEQAPAPSDQAGSKAGRISDPQGGTGRKSDSRGRKSDSRGRKSDPDTQGDQGERDLPLVPPSGSSLSGDPSVSAVSAVAAEAGTGERDTAAPNNDNPAPAPASVPVQATAQQQEEEQRDAGTAEAVDLDVMLAALPGLGYADAVELAPLVAAALADGWTTAGLYEYLAARCDTARVAFPPAVYRKHLKALPAPQAAAPAAPTVTRAELIAACTECDEWGQYDAADGRVGTCAHPKVDREQLAANLAAAHAA